MITDFFIPLFIWLLGFLMGYIRWAPDTSFKRSFIDGLSLRFIWGRWVK